MWTIFRKCTRGVSQAKSRDFVQAAKGGKSLHSVCPRATRNGKQQRCYAATLKCTQSGRARRVQAGRASCESRAVTESANPKSGRKKAKPVAFRLTAPDRYILNNRRTVCVQQIQIRRSKNRVPRRFSEFREKFSSSSKWARHGASE